MVLSKRTLLDNFINDLDVLIEGYRDRGQLRACEVIGVLEIAKADIVNELLEGSGEEE